MIVAGDEAGSEVGHSVSRKGTWPQALGSFAVSIAMILGFRWAFFEPYVIPSGSMIPTLLVHDHILVNKFAYGLRVPFTKTWILRFSGPSRGDVVVFNSVEERGVFMVKRVVGLPGDVVESADDGTLLINGKPLPRVPLDEAAQLATTNGWSNPKATDFLDENTIENETLGDRAHVVARSKSKRWLAEGPFKVPEGHLFMMGDNRDNSRDSREWGSLPADHVLGRASVIWLSCEETLKQAAQVCDPQTLRWRRMFQSVR